MSIRARSILLTGCTGAIGSQILARLAGNSIDRIYGVFSRPDTYARLRASFPSLNWERLVPIYIDLRSDHALNDLDRELSGVQLDTIIHAAADVSWTRTESALASLNVRGTQRVAQWAYQAAPGARFIHFSTAYAHRPNGVFLNDYERTKHEAEAFLVEKYSDRLKLGIIRPSLVIGDSGTGAIERFNGLYPLVRVLAFGEVPCVIGDRDYKVDLVPVDWVIEDLVRLLGEVDEASKPLFVTAAAGHQSLPLNDIVNLIVARLNVFLDARGMARSPEISVIKRRQFDFLMNAAASWNIEQRFEHAKRVSELMAGYLNHSEGAVELEPTWFRAYPHGASEVIGRCVDFWLSRHEARLCTPRNVHWSAGLADA